LRLSTAALREGRVSKNDQQRWNNHSSQPSHGVDSNAL
jgi:hypothetical protein